MASKSVFRPSDYIESSQRFSVEIRKTEDGKFAASSPNRPEIEPVVDADRQTAIQGLNQKLNAFIQGGFQEDRE